MKVGDDNGIDSVHADILPFEGLQNIGRCFGKQVPVQIRKELKGCPHFHRRFINPARLQPRKAGSSDIQHLCLGPNRLCEHLPGPGLLLPCP